MAWHGMAHPRSEERRRTSTCSTCVTLAEVPEPMLCGKPTWGSPNFRNPTSAAVEIPFWRGLPWFNINFRKQNPAARKGWGRWKLQIVFCCEVICEMMWINYELILYTIYYNIYIYTSFSLIAFELCQILADRLHCCCADCLVWASQRMPVGSGRSWGINQTYGCGPC